MRILRRNRKGFTLIELLVVVLIIGILAAVALPQYKMAVAKSRLSKLVVMMDSVAKAEESYYLANGKYTNDWDQLAVSLPGSVAMRNVENDSITSGTWRVTLQYPSSLGLTAVDRRVSGVTLWHFFHGSHLWSGQNVCYANMDNNHANKLCKIISHRTVNDGANSDTRMYSFR